MVKDLSKYKVEEAKGIIGKSFGMLLERNGKGIILKTRFGIHTFFMKKAIDVLVLDNGGKVAGIRENLKPNSFYFWNIRHDTVIELPAGTVEKENISVGDKLNF